MIIEIKIIITLIVVWLALYGAAMPDTKFAEWGEVKFGSYGRFLNIIACIFLVPVLIIGLYLLWK